MNNHRSILALDPATRTGWAVGGHGSVVSGVVDFKQHRGNRAMLFEAFDLWLSDMVTERDPAMLVFEMPIQRGPGSRTGFGLATVIELTAARRGLFVGEINLATLKKHATGNGRADKAAMVEAARARGWTPETDDEADALLLLSYVTTNMPEGALAA